jgi:hypothetical protein
MPELRARADRERFCPGSFLFFQKRGDFTEILAQYTIYLDPRTKKNHMTIAGTGPKCPKCGKKARQFVRQGSANTKFAFEATRFLFPKPMEPLNEPLHIVYRLYMQTKRRVDDLNLYASLDDLLVSNGIIKDDCISIIRCRDGSRVDYDKAQPRAEIYIYKYREEEDNWQHRPEPKCSL